MGSLNHTTAILLGSNLGDRIAQLQIAKKNISAYAGKIIKESSIYSTVAWGNTQQPDFFNQCLIIQTPFCPKWLMKKLLEIELRMGRKRLEKWGPRTIDIDILFYDQRIIKSELLMVPHPELPKRKFALVPLVEIHKHWKHPEYQLTALQLLLETPDQLMVKKVNKSFI